MSAHGKSRHAPQTSIPCSRQQRTGMQGSSFEFRSAPYFDLFIDGITNIDA